MHISSQLIEFKKAAIPGNPSTRKANDKNK